jgi:hypothetical protein
MRVETVIGIGAAGALLALALLAILEGFNRER